MKMPRRGRWVQAGSNLLARGMPKRAVHGTPIRVVLSEPFAKLDRA